MHYRDKRRWLGDGRPRVDGADLLDYGRAVAHLGVVVPMTGAECNDDGIALEMLVDETELSAILLLSRKGVD